MPEHAYRLRDLHDHDQATPAGLRPSQRCCIRCGRVTARRDTEGLPWCGGEPVAELEPLPRGAHRVAN